MMAAVSGCVIREVRASPGPNSAFHLVCLSGYLKHLVHLLLGNTEAFPDSLYVCVCGIVLLRLFYFILKKEISKFKLHRAQSQ